MELTVDVSSIISKIKEILTSPKKFFDKSKKEKGWKTSFVFILVIAAIGHILTALYNIIFYPILGPVMSEALGVPVGQFDFGQVLVASLISYILTLGMSFIWGAALKVWLSLFKVSSTFDQSFRVMAYSRTPNYLFSWLPLVNLAAALYSFYLLMIGIEQEYSLPRKKALIIIISSIVALFVISFLVVSVASTI